MAGPLPLNVSMGSSAGLSPVAARLQGEFQQSMRGVLMLMRVAFNAIDGATPGILAEVLEPTFEKSQVYCPVSSGRLKGSGYVVAEKAGNGAVAEIGYARDGDPDYAIFVHEMPYDHAEPTRDK